MENNPLSAALDFSNKLVAARIRDNHGKYDPAKDQESVTSILNHHHLIMNHKFAPIPIPDGEKNVTETCIRCPQKRLRFAGTPEYFTYPYGNKPCGEAEHPAKEYSIISQNVNVDRFTDKKLHDIQPLHSRRAPVSVSSYLPIPEADARLKEALIIVHLLYEDLVGNDIRSKSRQIAGRFLYSQKYQELADKFE